MSGQTVTTIQPAGTPPMVLPHTEAEETPAVVFCNALVPRPIPLRLSPGAAVDRPEGWRTEGPALRPPPQPLSGPTHHVHPLQRARADRLAH